MSVETVAAAAMRFFEARNERNRKLKAFKDYCVENGAYCDLDGPSCYKLLYGQPLKEWCAQCAARQPMWEAYRDAAKASSKAQSVLRGACMRHARQPGPTSKVACSARDGAAG